MSARIKRWKDRLNDLDEYGRPFERDIEAADAEIADLRAALASQSVAELEIARKALEKIANWSFGWDGDCGVRSAAEDALEAMESAAPQPPAVKESDIAIQALRDIWNTHTGPASVIAHAALEKLGLFKRTPPASNDGTT